VLLFAMHISTVQAAAATGTTTGLPVRIRSATDRYEDFPLDMQPVIDFSTVEYETVPIYDPNIHDGDIITVNTDKLKVGLRIAMKDGAHMDGPYRMVIRERATKMTVTDDTYDADDVVTLDVLKYNEGYTITIETESGDNCTIYNGDFYYGVDIGNVVFCSLLYTMTQTPKTPPPSDVPDENPGQPAGPVQPTHDWVWYAGLCVLLPVVLYLFLRKRQ
jgi:hypothetical protein